MPRFSHVYRPISGSPTFTTYGFDAPVALTDFDDDGDQADFGHLQGCMTEPGIAPGDRACADGDLDHDNDVDAGDFEVFAACLSGAGASPGSNCWQ